jgi:hypothetical protein
MILRCVTNTCAVLVLTLVLAACGGGSSDPEPTATSEIPPTPTVEVVTGSTTTDGICQITIPDDWVDDGTGRGETSLGDRWTLFGGSATTDTAWTAAKDLLKSRYDGIADVTINDSDNQVTVIEPNGRGYYLRQRFETTYCDFSVSSTRDNEEKVTQTWVAVSETLALLKR